MCGCWWRAAGIRRRVCSRPRPTIPCLGITVVSAWGARERVRWIARARWGCVTRAPGTISSGRRGAGACRSRWSGSRRCRCDGWLRPNARSSCVWCAARRVTSARLAITGCARSAVATATRAVRPSRRLSAAMSGGRRRHRAKDSDAAWWTGAGGGPSPRSGCVARVADGGIATDRRGGRVCRRFCRRGRGGRCLTGRAPRCRRCPSGSNPSSWAGCSF